MPRKLPTRIRGGAMPVGCGVVFFGIFLSVGVLVGLFGFVSPPEGLRPWFARAEECRVVSSTVERPEGAIEGEARTSRAVITFGWPASLPDGDPGLHVTDDQRWMTEEKAVVRIREFPAGARVPCFVERDEPPAAYLERGLSPDFALILFPLVFGGVGLGGIIWTISSAITRARRRRSRLEWVPRVAIARVPEGWSWSAGASRFGSAIGLTFFAFFWNAISSIPLIIFFSEELEESGNYLVLLFGVVFGLIGLAIIFAAAKAWLVAVRVPVTRVVASKPHVAPGAAVELVVTQPGKFAIRKLTVRVTCTEKVTFTVGTDTRTESHVAFERTLAEAERLDASSGRPAELRTRFSVPDDAMHSFEGARNEVCWQLHVFGELDGWPDFEHVFPVLVLPEGVIPDAEER